MLAAMPEQIVNSPNYRWLADQPCFADGDSALIVSASGILLFDSGNALLARPGIAQIPELGRLKSGDPGGPAAQSAPAKAWQTRATGCLAVLYSIAMSGVRQNSDGSMDNNRSTPNPRRGIQVPDIYWPAPFKLRRGCNADTRAVSRSSFRNERKTDNSPNSGSTAPSDLLGLDRQPKLGPARVQGLERKLAF
jgi:hypothetical protein